MNNKITLTIITTSSASFITFGLVSTIVFANEVAQKFSDNLFIYLVNPIIGILFVVSLVVFIYGIIKYVINEDSSADRKTSIQTITYGLIGLFFVTSAFSILKLIGNLAETEIESSIFE